MADAALGFHHPKTRALKVRHKTADRPQPASFPYRQTPGQKHSALSPPEGELPVAMGQRARERSPWDTSNTLCSPPRAAPLTF